MPTDTLQTIDPAMLSRVSGGASSNDQITAALSQITSSLSALSQNKSQSDPTMMMMMMMMMMGGGGGGGGVVSAGVPGAAAGPPVINVDTSLLRGAGIPGFGGGAGGGFGGGAGGCFCPPPSGKKGW
jgi:hypothetical protein